MNENEVREFRPVAGKRASGLLAAAVAGIFAIPLLYALVSWLWAPRQLRYDVTSAYLTIHMASGFTGDSKRIPMGRVDEVSQAWLHGGELRFGTVKSGYCVGYFRYPSLGEVWQATDCTDEGVVIHASGEVNPVVVTPGDRDAFLAAMSSGRTGSFPARVRPEGVSWGTLVTLITILWSLAAVLGAILFVAPARLRYRVRGSTLEVATLIGRQRFPLAGMKAGPHQPLLGERMSGLGVPGYFAGVFVFDTAPTSVYATTQDDGVLLEGDLRIFVTPERREAFLQALAAGGAALR